jgi:hypothetical protein
MRASRIALALLFSLACAAVAQATPSTLIWIPSTDIQADKTWHFGIDNYFSPEGGTRSATDIGLEYGFLKGRAEAGIDYLGGQDDPFFFNAKYLLTPEKASTPAVVVGFYNGGTKRQITDANMLFALGSKTFNGTRLTLGYAHGKQATLTMGADMLLAGIDRQLSKKWWAAADYQSGNSAFGALNFGVAYSFADNVSVIFGYDIYNNHTLNPKNTFTTQLDVNF